MGEKKKYLVKIIHEYVVEAENEDEAEDLANEMGYGMAKDCYFEVEKW